jgi:hypothetical protein
MKEVQQRQPYQPPKLEAQPWQQVTGVSLAIGTLGLPDNPLEAYEEIQP